MARYDEVWVEALVDGHRTDGDADASTSVVYVVTDTDEGKVAFNLHLDGEGVVAAGAGKLPRGVKPDITLTLKESVALDLWSGDRSRDAAFMAGDIKVEGAYEVWIDSLVALFEADEWNDSWARAAAG